MKIEPLKIVGRIVNTNTLDQSFCIESEQSKNRLRVYADDTLFKRLNNDLCKLRFAGKKDKEITSGTFYIQGRVLVDFYMENTDFQKLGKVLCQAFKELRSK
jgi:hypothetical protein